MERSSSVAQQQPLARAFAKRCPHRTLACAPLNGWRHAMHRHTAYAVLLPLVASSQTIVAQPAIEAARPTASPSAAIATTAALDAATYLAKAAAGDRFELESARLILAKAPDPQVAAFARMMIEDHSRSSARLAQAARQDGLAMPAPALDSTQTAALDGLRQAQGATAQQVYLAGQRDAHTAALALHRAYAEQGDKPALRAAANAIVPVVAHHADMLSRIASQTATSPEAAPVKN
jgi:putative membrane protein